MARATPIRPRLAACDSGETLTDVNGCLLKTTVPEERELDVPLFRVSMQMYKDAAEAFYGTNLFMFDSADVARAWMELIGPNAAHISRLHLVLGAREHGLCQTREERLWLVFLARFPPGLTLSEITVDFRNWLPMEEIGRAHV